MHAAALLHPGALRELPPTLFNTFSCAHMPVRDCEMWPLAVGARACPAGDDPCIHPSLSTHCRVVQVADIADVVRQRADCLMLSGESAVGAYPDKAVGVLRAVATRIEEWCR